MSNKFLVDNDTKDILHTFEIVRENRDLKKNNKSKITPYDTERTEKSIEMFMNNPKAVKTYIRKKKRGKSKAKRTKKDCGCS